MSTQTVVSGAGECGTKTRQRGLTTLRHPDHGLCYINFSFHVLFKNAQLSFEDNTTIEKIRDMICFG
jgi:hypothetical protein